MSLIIYKGWLNNPTTTRYGKELLERIIENCTQSTVEDLEALRLIVRIKIKANTSVNQFYFEKLTKLLGNNPHFPFIGKCHQYNLSNH